MKKKVGELYGKKIVVGDKNLVTENELHVSKIGGNVDIEQLLWFGNGYHVSFVMDFNSKTIEFVKGGEDYRYQINVPGYDIAVCIDDSPRGIAEFVVISGSYRIYTEDGIEIPRIIKTYQEYETMLKSTYIVNWSDLGDYPVTFIVESLVDGKKYKILMTNESE